MATVTWTGSVGNTDWSNPANWIGGVPGADDDVIISGAFAVNITTAATSRSVLLDGGATLTLGASGVLSVATTLSVGATGILRFDRGILQGGTLDLAPGAQVQATSQAQNNLESVLDGVTVTGEVLTVGFGSRLTLANGTTGVNSDDTLAAAGGSILTLRDDDGPYLLDQTLSMRQLALTVASPVASPNANFIIDATGVLRGSGAVFSQFPGFSGQVDMINLGVVESSLTGSDFGDGFLNILPNSFTNAGTVRVAAGTSLLIGNAQQPLDANHVFTNLTAGILTGGFYDVLDTATLNIVGDVAPITTLAAQISLTGPDSHFQVNGQELEASLTTLSDTGQINLFFGHTFDAANAITVAGFLNLQGSIFDAPNGIALTTTGFIGGYGTITGNIVNNGAILAAGIETAPALTINGNLSGINALSIGGDSVLELTGAVSNGTVTFEDAAGSDGKLRISNAATFDATIAGLAAGDAIDLANVAATSAALDPGNAQELDLFVGATVVASLQLSGDYAGASFATANDGKGGTVITLGTQQAVAFYNGVLQVFGPDAYDYTHLFPALSAALSAELIDVGNGRQQYVVNYIGGTRAVFEGTGLTLGTDEFDAAGGVVDIIEVFDTSTGGQPFLLARFSSDVAGGNVMSVPFDVSLAAGLASGGPDFYQQLLHGNNRIIGSSNDDILTDDWGNNVIDGGAGFNTLYFGPKVTDIPAVTLGAEPASGTITYVDDIGQQVVTAIQNLVSNIIPIPSAQQNWHHPSPPPPPPDDDDDDTDIPDDDPPPDSAGGSGDPHITTFDQLHYDLQSVGEFVLARAFDGSSFEVQGRFASLGFDRVTFTTQIGVQVGGQRVTVDAGNAEQTIIRIDGSNSGIGLPSIGSTIDLDAGRITKIGGSAYGGVRIALDSGERVTILDRGSYLDFTVSLGAGHTPGSVRGILGSDDANTANDFVLPDGTTLAQPLSFSQLYDTFADAWRVTDATSLLDYEPGQTTATFTDLDFPSQALTVADLPATVRVGAMQLALQAGLTDPALIEAAMYDFAVTGDVAVFAAMADRQVAGSLIAATMHPSGAPTGGALGILPLAASVTEGSGAITPVTFQVYRTGDTAEAVTVDFAVVAPGTGFFDAADFGGTLPAGQVTIPAGATGAIFSIDIANAVISLAEERLRVEIDGPPGVPVLGDKADVSVINSGPAPGIFADPVLVEAVAGASLVRNGNTWTLDLGSLAQGATLAPLAFAIANNAGPNANFLSGSFDAIAASGFTVSSADPFLKLAAGDVGGDFSVALDTSAPGQFTQTITLHAKQGNRSGFSEQLSDQVLIITANIAAPNGPPTVTGAVTATATEDSGIVAVDLLAGASDPDGDTPHVANVAGLRSGITLVGDSLAVDTGNAALQSLAAGVPLEIALAYEIIDGRGGSVPQNATVTITGINDRAEIAGVTTGAVTEDATLIARGLLRVTDVDTGEAVFQAGTFDGAYGSLSLDAAGNWTYTLNNSNSAVQALDAGDSLPDRIQVRSFDGTAINIDITINGADETSVITGTNKSEILRGTDASDVITALGGHDVVRAGRGDDLLKASVNDGDDSYFGGLGSDTIDFSALTKSIEVNLERGCAVSRQSGDDLLDSIENVIGTSVADQIWGDNSGNYLFGGDGNDRIDGGRGDDEIEGGGGNDNLGGGVGTDIFVFRPEFGRDKITDFDANAKGGQDYIALEGFGITADSFASRVDITRVGGDTLVTVDDNLDQTIRILGVNSSTVTVDDFRFG